MLAWRWVFCWGAQGRLPKGGDLGAEFQVCKPGRQLAGLALGYMNRIRWAGMWGLPRGQTRRASLQGGNPHIEVLVPHPPGDSSAFLETCFLSLTSDRASLDQLSVCWGAPRGARTPHCFLHNHCIPFLSCVAIRLALCTQQAWESQLFCLELQDNVLSARSVF